MPLGLTQTGAGHPTEPSLFLRSGLCNSAFFSALLIKIWTVLEIVGQLPEVFQLDFRLKRLGRHLHKGMSLEPLL